MKNDKKRGLIRAACFAVAAIMMLSVLSAVLLPILL